MTLAAVAWRELDAATKKKLTAVFAADGRLRQFLDAATWPDDIRAKQRNGTPFMAPVDAGWHSVDIPRSCVLLDRYECDLAFQTPHAGARHD